VTELSALQHIRQLAHLLAEEIRLHLGRTAPVQAKLDTVYRAAVTAGRTSQTWQQWRDEQAEQIAQAWLLGTIFVRYAEDNQLMPLAEPSGDTATWWLSRFSALTAALGAGPGQVTPTTPDMMSEAGAQLLTCSWFPDGQRRTAIDLTEPSLGTALLGDLYQELSESSRRRYALLQTPTFVERFILDQTLEPAISQFGLDGLRLIDPVCGSGSFLLGAFDRLLTHWAGGASTLNPAERVQRALASVHGIDLNPSAVLITRFRLLIAAYKACPVGQNASPSNERQLSIVQADALLDDGAAQDPGLTIEGYFHVVVGNPPYVTVQDSATDKLYRKRYDACAGKYALTVPFIQRFFQLARAGDDKTAGYVGLLAANSFTKREFGRRLIEEVLAHRVTVTQVVDTSGAFIPGHGTPTLVLFGRNRPSQESDEVLVIAGRHGEPATPADPARGLVWQSILRHADTGAGSDRWTEAVTHPYETFRSFPWQLSGNTHTAVMQRLSGARQLGDIVSRITYLSNIGADDIFMAPAQVWRRQNAEAERVVDVLTGSDVRDWTATATSSAFFPRDQDLGLVNIQDLPGHHRRLWPFRTLLGNRPDVSGRIFFASNRPWYDWHTISGHPCGTTPRIVFAWVATHPHFAALESAAALPSAPIVELLPGASDVDRAVLMATLNSSTVCFWLKQVSHSKGISSIHRTTGNRGEPWEITYEFTPGRVRELPLPADLSDAYVMELDRLARLQIHSTAARTLTTGAPGAERLVAARRQWESARGQMIALAEELDWQVYARYGLLAEPGLACEQAVVPEIRVGERAFEIALARRLVAGTATQTSWFARHGAAPTTEIPSHWPQAYRDLVAARIRAIESDPNLRVLESPEFKRRWTSAGWDAMEHSALRDWLLDRCDDPELWYDECQRPRPHTIASLAATLRTTDSVLDAAALYAPTMELTEVLHTLVTEEIIPSAAAARYKDSGLAKWAKWKSAWAQQREEDRLRSIGDHTAAYALQAKIPTPPRYVSTDFRQTSYWRLRGRYDVPTERFISYPLPSSNDPDLLVGWAGWSDEDRVLVLVDLIEAQLTTKVPADKSLVPLLAALQESLEWVDCVPGRTTGDAGAESRDKLSRWLDQCKLTERDVERWRPKPPRRGRPPKRPSP